MIPGLGQQSITGLLGITKQHVGVLLEEDWIVDGRIADTKCSLHHDHLQLQQDFSSMSLIIWTKLPITQCTILTAMIQVKLKC